MGFYELINVAKMRFSKQMTVNAEVSFNTFGKELVMVGQQISCTSVGPVWKQCLLVIGCLFLHFDWVICILPILL